MFMTIFFSIIRCLVIPLVAFYALQPSLGDKAAFLVVTIALTVTNILSIIWLAIKILPNMVLLRGGKIFKSIIRIVIEVTCIIGFWIYYLTTFQ